MSTEIAWTDETWNPILGCSHAGFDIGTGKAAHPGCQNCYAERFASRGLTASHAEVASKGKWNGKVVFQPERLAWPFERWKARRDGTGRRIFVASMSDIGHPALSDEHRAAIYGAMLLSPWNTYQNLTKRPQDLARFKREWTPLRCVEALFRILPTVPGSVLAFVKAKWANYPHIHEVVSISDQATADALVPELLAMPAAVRGVSCEPMTGSVDLWCLKDGSWWDREGADRYNALTGTAFWNNGDHGIGGGPRLSWVIIGGESGPGARPFDLRWARDLIDQCRTSGVPVWMKQIGSKPLSHRDFLLINNTKGADPREWPEDLRVQMHVGDAWR